MKICDEGLCIGCMACKNVCMNNAIEIVQNKQGFYKPLVNDTKYSLGVSSGLKQNMCNQL